MEGANTMIKYKVPFEEKVRIVKSYIEGEAGYSECLQAANNSDSAFRRWLALYREGGAAALLPKEKPTVYPEETKRAVVEEYLLGKVSMEKLCQKYGLRSHTQIQHWLKVYNTHGDFKSKTYSGGGSNMRQGRETTQEERIQIVRECIASGKNYGEMALKYRVSYQQVRTWTLRFEAMGEAGLQDRRGRRKKDQAPRTELEQAQIEIEQLKHKLYMVEMENALLKKLDEVERRDAFRK